MVVLNLQLFPSISGEIMVYLVVKDSYNQATIFDKSFQRSKTINGYDLKSNDYHHFIDY